MKLYTGDDLIADLVISPFGVIFPALFRLMLFGVVSISKIAYKLLLASLYMVIWLTSMILFKIQRFAARYKNRRDWKLRVS